MIEITGGRAVVLSVEIKCAGALGDCNQLQILVSEGPAALQGYPRPLVATTGS